ncbi:hypothetical protein [Bythopirellula goksoeyrii]|uniref:Secreted protein n=1 Tax=Bythopirellula goksoeyrii TaxID=1400387 RepID=A0A5B9QNU9_9BACT|nr:hypothetical protein [Bythopirellula goksoeyrii]QEG35791.1 hypothetical protein Pr1d_30970 [Bythopirellula goksoeyrii]
MTILRSHLMLTLAIALFVNGLGSSSLLADDSPSHGTSTNHDHDAMKMEKKITDALASLSPEDRKQAEAQRFCPIMQYSRLGSMGAPLKVTVAGQQVFVCCEGCVEDAIAGGQETLKTAQKLTDVSANLAKLPANERAAAEAQKFCAVANKNLLGAMGEPVKLKINGKPVYLCCKGCTGKAQANPAATLAKVEVLKKAGMKAGHDHSDHNHERDHNN